ncbi:MAG: hypothetical protein JXC32_19515 [Anaerolineae bacterium]|nr:hypothetical protein [Anaerolineae bacterium]
MDVSSLKSTIPVPWFEPAVDDLSRAVLYTLAYSDVFDYPLTLNQVWRYLIGIPASRGAVQTMLHAVPEVETDGTYYFLAGRQMITELREARAEIARRMWPRVRRYGARIARLPFVRMVALTGALAMVNAPARDDFDFLIVTEPGYLWLSRALVIALVVRPSKLMGDEVCPNYLITTESLTFTSRDLYTAHELAQMVPLAGKALYAKLRERNAWVYEFLPNAQGAPDDVAGEAPSPKGWLSRRLAEPLLRSDLGARLDQWEMARKIPRLAAGHSNPEISFDRDHCKGHIGAHQAWVCEGFLDRVSRLRQPGTP